MKEKNAPVYRPMKALTTLSLLGLLLSAPCVSQAAVSIFLSPLTTAVTVGSQITYTVYLSGANNVGGYDFNIFITPTQLQFDNPSTPFTAASPNPFSLAIQNTLTTPGDLRVASTVPLNSTTGFTNPGPVALGSFSVTSLVPFSASSITFAPVGSGSRGGSEVDNFASGSNELTATVGASVVSTSAAPEPSEVGVLALIGFGLGGVLLRARRRQSAFSKRG